MACVNIYIFHTFNSFLGKKPPCCDVMLETVGMDVVLYALSIIFDIL